MHHRILPVFGLLYSEEWNGTERKTEQKNACENGRGQAIKWTMGRYFLCILSK